MAQNRQQQRKKLFAVLAGGLVLGVGTSATLASWNDSEFATADFGSGALNLVGSIDGTVYADHSAAGAAALQFTLPLSSQLSPGDTVYAPYWVRVDSTTTAPATLTASAVTATDSVGTNSAHLAFEVRAIDATASCDASASTSPLLASGASLDALTPGDAITLATGVDGGEGDAVQLCFAITADSGLQQSASTTATWQLDAISS